MWLLLLEYIELVKCVQTEMNIYIKNNNKRAVKI
jgi:hypothetical protein